jgi:hypothetical protein
MDGISDCTAPSHYWLIGEPNGHTSPGLCKHCGAGRDFPNWLPEFEYAGREESRIIGSPSQYRSARVGRSY